MGCLVDVGKAVIGMNMVLGCETSHRASKLKCCTICLQVVAARDFYVKNLLMPAHFLSHTTFNVGTL